MSLESALRAGRAAAERQMADTVVVKYPDPSGAVSQDPDTGATSPVLLTRFTSRCKVQARDLAARIEEVGGRSATTVRVELHLPVSAPAVEPGDLCEVTAVGALSDVQLLGRRFRVVAPVAKSFATARRVDVEEVVS